MSLLDLEAVTFIDFAALEDAMPKQACEHQQHDSHPLYHRDGDEHYVRVFYPCCQMPSKVIVVCKFFLDVAVRTGLVCRYCQALYLDLSEVLIDLGPVKP